MSKTINKKILITGGAGFIGSHCVDLFLERGYDVGVFDIKSNTEAINLTHVFDKITYITGDIRDKAELDAVMGDFDYVLHLAAIVSVPLSLTDPVGTHATNVTGTLNVLTAAKDHGIKRVVYASSAAVYGDAAVVPTPEDAPLQPLSPYGLHKVINEQYAELYTKQFGLSTIGLRFFNVYGSRQDPSSPYSGVISIFTEKMRNGQQPIIFGDGSATRDFIHVSDVAQACLLAVETPIPEPFICNIASGEQISINELAVSCNRVLDTQLEPIHQSARNGDIQHSGAKVERAKRTLSFESATALQDGLQEMVK